MENRNAASSVLRPMENIEKLLKANVDASRMVPYLCTLSVLDDLNAQLDKNPELLQAFPGHGVPYRGKISELQGLLALDLSGKSPEERETHYNLLADQLDLLSSLYQHLHNKGHSGWIDSGQYTAFRDSLKAIHKAWKEEPRTISVNSPEERARTQDAVNSFTGRRNRR